jgi:hypothetical protein
MAIPLSDYRNIHTRYCVAYFGPHKEYLIQLKMLRPMIEAQLPGLEMHIGCADLYAYLLEGERGIIRQSEFFDRRLDYCYVRELKCDMVTHPVLQLIEESNILVEGRTPGRGEGGRCVIVPTGLHPTRNATQEMVNKARNHYAGRGYRIEVGGDADDADLVVGVEGEPLFSAADRGLPTALLATGLGTRLYQKMFPQADVFTDGKNP